MALRPRLFGLVAVLGSFCGCDSRDPPGAPEPAVRDLACPAAPESRLPRWGRDLAGRLLLSWVEESSADSGSATATLRFARLGADGLGPAGLVASGEDWFVNWADVPSVAALDERNLLAQYLRRNAEGTYDYGVLLVRSSDGGATWSDPVRLHEDAGRGEHGFVSLVPVDPTRYIAVWLDGRHAGGHDAGSDSGAMSLYLRTVAADGALGEEVLLDDRVCDCCPTSAVATEDGALLVAYRDRSEEEVRDVSVVRFERGTLTSSWASRDGWRIAGCPVNGPVIRTSGSRVAVVWFTLGDDGAGRVLVAFSEDGGRIFSPPAKIAGEPTSGRVDAVFDRSGDLVVAWLASEAGEDAWRLARVDRSGRTVGTKAVASAEGGRGSGLARLASTDSGIVLAYTESRGGPRVALKRIAWSAPSDDRPR